MRRIKLQAFAISLCLLAWSSVAATAYPNKRQQLWALATSAVLFERNGQQLDTLAGDSITPEYKAAEQQSLVGWWDIHNRQELLKTLQWLRQDGHRSSFNYIGKRLKKVSDAEFARGSRRLAGNPTLWYQFVLVRRYYPKLGDRKSILGWDYSRYVALCRWGYACGYLSQAEAWKYIMPAAIKLQHAFVSWRELGQNYLIGHMFWTGSSTAQHQQETEDAYRQLCSDPSSPWKKLPWNLKLTP